MPLSALKRLFASSEPTSSNEAREFALPDQVRVYAVGDIHGRAGVLRKMLAAIEEDAAKHPIRRNVQVFLGDYIDRGMESKEVVEMLLQLPPIRHERICLMGNHEEALLHFLKDPNILRDWANFGGYATLASYGIPIPETMTPERLAVVRDAFARSIPPSHMAFYKNLQLRATLGEYVFVHAGIQPGIPLEQQKPQHMLWIRDSFLNHQGFFDHYIVHGHTPVTEPEIKANRANLDISASPVNSLCCLVIEGSERRSFTITQE